MNREVILKAILAAVLFPMLAVLLFVTGSIVWTANDRSVRLLFAALTAFLGSAGVIAGRILLLRASPYLNRLKSAQLAPSQVVDLALSYFESRVRTLKLCAAFGLLLASMHLAMFLTARVTLKDFLLLLLATAAFPTGVFWTFLRHNFRAHRLLRSLRDQAPDTRLAVAKHLAQTWLGDPVAMAVLNRLTESGL